VWIETYSGKRFNLLNPDSEMVDITDIAHALSNTCRFGGHSREFYSVAQHCVLCSKVAPEAISLQALLHDAPEAYINDIPTPVKGLLPQYKQLEDKIWKIIANKYKVSEIMDPLIKEIDRRMLVTEARDLMHCNNEWVDEMEMDRYPIPLQVWTPKEAKEEFLKRFRRLRMRAKNRKDTND
jgi:5'-deoxynucleotidase YfbR-like HD superfamily hydrolase